MNKKVKNFVGFSVFAFTMMVIIFVGIKYYETHLLDLQVTLFRAHVRAVLEGGFMNNVQYRVQEFLMTFFTKGQYVLVGWVLVVVECILMLLTAEDDNTDVKNEALITEA